MPGKVASEVAMFVPVHHPEPHGPRRRALLRAHPELRALAGFDRRTGAVMILLALAQLLLARGWTVLWTANTGASPLARVALGFGLVAAAYALGGTVSHWLGMGIHEAAHNLVARTTLANRGMALLANVPILMPAAMPFRRHHLRHHSHLGIEGADNDLASAFEVRWTGRSPLRKGLWLALYPFFAAFGRGFVKRPDGWEWLNVGTQVLTVAILGPWLGAPGLAYLGLSTFFGYGLLHPAAAHFIHEHYLWNPRQETYSYYGPLNHVTFNVGYHVEHHDLPNIPGWRLPEVHRRAKPFYADFTSHRSWTAILWRFVWDPAVGHDSRFVRTRRTTASRRPSHAHDQDLGGHEGTVVET